MAIVPPPPAPQRTPGKTSILFVGLLLAATASAGCGSGGLPRGNVSGVVTFDGQPVTGGIVHFLPARGPAASGVLDAGGHYELTTAGHGPGAVVGDHTIYFAPLADESAMSSYSQADYLAGKPPPATPPQKLLPERFLNPATSSLTAQVAAGENRLDWALASP